MPSDERGGIAPGTPPGHRIVGAAFVVSVLATALLAFAPMLAVVESVSEVAAEDGEVASEPERRTEIRVGTLTQAQGWGPVIVIGGLLLLLSGIPLVARRRRTALAVRGMSTVLLFAGALVGAPSFGILYFPVAGLMLMATLVALPGGASENRPS
jgi:hypothetical protein